jgi:hypothetical protein
MRSILCDNPSTGTEHDHAEWRCGPPRTLVCGTQGSQLVCTWNHSPIQSLMFMTAAPAGTGCRPSMDVSCEAAVVCFRASEWNSPGFLGRVVPRTLTASQRWRQHARTCETLVGAAAVVSREDGGGVPSADDWVHRRGEWRGREQPSGSAASKVAASSRALRRKPPTVWWPCEHAASCGCWHQHDTI